MTNDIPVFFQDKPVINIVIKAEEPKPKEPRLYTIKQGDNLTKIAEAHNVPVSRLWSANTTLTDPDRIEPSQSLRIPENEEVLPERPLPVTVEVRNPPSSHGDSKPSTTGGFSSVKRSGKSTPGWYYAGQCTGYVASRRFVPDGWGNASDWKYHAQAEGWTVSSVPVVGAIGWTSGHVVYVESVNGNSTVTISEQNYDYRGSIRTVTVPQSKYTYLY